jgi:hypothetical protein
MISDKIIYCLNSAAVGDLVASAPALKWAIETCHKRAEYRVALLPEFRELFPFVPGDKIIPLAEKYDPNFSVRKLNLDGGGGNITRLTPSRFKLTHYACIGLLARIIPDQHLKYVPLPEVDISRYNVDFTNAAVFIVTYRDITRAWKGDEIIKTAEHVYKKGFTPIFIGKLGGISIWKTLAVSDFVYPGFGVDLTNQTTFLEMATIMKKSKVVFGMDSGPVHIAFSTDTSVIAGYTNVAPQFRIPPRNPGIKTVAVTPGILCQFCQSDWNLDFWNFQKCPRGQDVPDCTKAMVSQSFIEAFDKLQLSLS